MSLRQVVVDLPGEDANSCSLQTCISAIEGMPAAERRLTYQECAKCLLIRYLIERNIVDGPVRDEECRPAAEDCVAENADGVCFLFHVQGSVWAVNLSRTENSKKMLEKNPERIKDSELFVMDLEKPAKINRRDSDFRK
jgi:hypothetical protein